MLFYTDLTKGATFILDSEPYEVLEYKFLRMQQRKAVVQTKIRNLMNGKVVSRNFHQNETFEETEIEKEELIFLYSHRGEFWFTPLERPPHNTDKQLSGKKNRNDAFLTGFHKKNSSQQRFPLSNEVIGDKAKFLKPNITVTAYKFRDKIINIALPVKMEFKVAEAPPNIRGNTSQGGAKPIVLENGLKIQAPLFIQEGDVVRINTETGEYTERVEKKI